MEDRELLELAARAAGRKFSHGTDQHDYGLAYADGVFWNPLTDDGDALRLALKRGIYVMVLVFLGSLALSIFRK